MKYNTSIRKLSEIKANICCLFVPSKPAFGEAFDLLDQSLDNFLSASAKKLAFKAESGSSLVLTPSTGSANQVVLIGLGAANELDKATLLKALDSAVNQVSGLNPKSVCFDLSSLQSKEEKDLSSAAAQSLITKLSDKAYRFDRYKSEKSKSDPINTITFACAKAQQSGVKKTIGYAGALAAGMQLTKDLGNEPGNVCTPSYLADTAKNLAKEFPSLKCKILEEKDMEKLNMGAFLSVSKGSTEPGKLIILEYKGGNAKAAPHVLVGKGITFDTGGISLKPGAQMDEMKYDMCGAASVLGSMRAIAELAPKKNIIGVIAAAENMPAGNASKPGDIVTTSSGQTVEILNTDAEGRLVLCDTLTYVEKFKPKTVVDIATLTGACIIALGHATSAVMSNDDDFAQTLMQSGQEADDKAWQLPLWDEYQKQIDSPFADMQNIGGRAAGSITAGCFLARFTKKYTWAHLDIAGTAWNSGANKGATGRPVPLLLNYLVNHAK